MALFKTGTTLHIHSGREQEIVSLSEIVTQIQQQWESCTALDTRPLRISQRVLHIIITTFRMLPAVTVDLSNRREIYQLIRRNNSL